MNKKRKVLISDVTGTIQMLKNIIESRDQEIALLKEIADGLPPIYRLRFVNALNKEKP